MYGGGTFILYVHQAKYDALVEWTSKNSAFVEHVSRSNFAKLVNVFVTVTNVSDELLLEFKVLFGEDAI